MKNARVKHTVFTYRLFKQGTDKNICHLVQQYQQNKWVCGGRPERRLAACSGFHPQRSEGGGLPQVPSTIAQKQFVQNVMVTVMLWPSASLHCRSLHHLVGFYNFSHSHEHWHYGQKRCYNSSMTLTTKISASLNLRECLWQISRKFLQTFLRYHIQVNGMGRRAYAMTVARSEVKQRFHGSRFTRNMRSGYWVLSSFLRFG